METGAAAILEKIRQNELAKHDLLSRFFSTIKITATSTYSSSKKSMPDVNEKIFRPDLYWKFFIVTLILVLLILLLQQLIFNFSRLNVFQAVAYILLTATAFFVLGYLYKKRNNNYSVIINDKGITIATAFFAWKDIYDTAILKERQNRNTSYFLIIIAANKQQYQKIAIDYLSGIGYWKTGAVLCRYIEYFKTRS